MKTVLLTGANGFLGGHICRELLSRNYAIRAFVRPGSDLRALSGLPVDVWTGDLRDSTNVRGAIYGCDCVIHAGAMTQVNPARSKTVVEVNVDGTAAVLAAAVQAGVERLVYVGTANVFGFGTKKKPGSETSPYMGQQYRLDYMDSKRVASDLVAQAVRQNGLPAVQVHPTFMLGPLDYKVTSNALLLALYKRDIVGIPAGGKNYVHVTDVATATVNALTMGRVGESYILGNENLSYREAFTKFANWMDVQPPTLRVPPALANVIGQLSEWKQIITEKPGRLNKAMTAVANDGHYFDVTKARHELNLPQTDLHSTVDQTIRWFSQHGFLV